MTERVNITKIKWEQSELCMGTVVQIKIIAKRNAAGIETDMRKAFSAFRMVEEVCSRFDERSELRQLSAQAGRAVPVSDMLFDLLRYALEVSRYTNGIFDPTLGRTLEKYGFNRHYLSGETIESSSSASESSDYSDVVLDENKRTVLLSKPLVLDLGAVAKGFAVDLAAKELRRHDGFMIDAGGDMYVGGLNEMETPWMIGIRHPLKKEEVLCTLRLSDMAVCTSGNYERISPHDCGIHHLIEPFSGTSSAHYFSCTVVAPYAMMADAMATSAYIAGFKEGAVLLEGLDLQGIWITPSLQLHKTKEMEKYIWKKE